jgi:hypothetical protein
LTKAYFRHKDLQQRENQKSLSSSNPLTKAYFRHKDLQQRESFRKGMEGRGEKPAGRNDRRPPLQRKPLQASHIPDGRTVRAAKGKPVSRTD